MSAEIISLDRVRLARAGRDHKPVEDWERDLEATEDAIERYLATLLDGDFPPGGHAA